MPRSDSTEPRFCCPLCRCTSYERVSDPKRPKQVYACAGCTVTFLDPIKFTRQDSRLGQQHCPPEGAKSPTR